MTQVIERQKCVVKVDRFDLGMIKKINRINNEQDKLCENVEFIKLFDLLKNYCEDNDITHELFNDNKLSILNPYFVSFILSFISSYLDESNKDVRICNSGIFSYMEKISSSVNDFL